MPSKTRYILGGMTGTSLDGLDVALVKIKEAEFNLSATLVTSHSEAMPTNLRALLEPMVRGDAQPPVVYLRAARMLGEFYRDACKVVMDAQPDVPIDFVAVHGQTIWHQPQDGLSWQLLDPWPLARGLRLPVVFDLRLADLIAGGQGAPLTPLADWVMYRGQANVIANLGGICNLTWLGEDWPDTRGADIWPCNLLLNGLCERLFHQPYDRDGELSHAVETNSTALKLITTAVERALPAGQGPTTLGRENFDDAWWQTLCAALTEYDSKVVLSSAITAVARQIADQAAGQSLLLAGGGVKNPTLLQAICEHHQGRVITSDQVGVPVDMREAMAFAILGALSQDRIAITLPAITGSTAPGIAGSWVYP